jgi:hypothetical protein
MKIIFGECKALGEHGVRPTPPIFFKKKITPAPSCEVAAHAWGPLGVFTESSATWLSAKMDFFEFTPTPSYSSGARGRKSAPSPVAESSSSSSSSEEEEQEDDEVQGGRRRRRRWGWERGRRSICEAIRHFRSDPYYP